VKLSKYDESKKVALIKEVKACVQGLNLVQAKKLVESFPIEIKTDLGMKEAEELKIQLEKAGAICEIIWVFEIIFWFKFYFHLLKGELALIFGLFNLLWEFWNIS